MSITIKHESQYKSIDNIGSISLPDFTVITGLNGAGKTHLLEAINLNNAGILIFDNDRKLTRIKYVTHATLTPKQGHGTMPKSMHNIIVQTYQKFNERKMSKENSPGQNFRDRIQLKVIDDIILASKKPVEEINENDFFTHYPIDDGLLLDDIFQQSFSALFARYYVKYTDNQYAEYRFETHGEGAYLTPEEFEKKHGPPPWDIINRIFEEAHVDYLLKTPIDNTHRDTPFYFHLVNKYSGIRINFDDLSSGEKVLVSIALSLYNLNMRVDFPEVLLMDEPDASLHPSMTKHFIDVLRKVFIIEKGVKVIMTTHSPSTIALCPEESIFVMNKSHPRLEKMSKDRALRLLTSGVPALSVTYENRRQIFVESKFDQILFEGIYRKLSKHIESDISLNFMCPGLDGSAGSFQVKDIVRKLSSFGNPYVYGIIDWDLKNKEIGSIRVLGGKNRYSIENYIFDPLILSLYLLREKIIEKSEINLSEEEGYLDIRTFSATRLQPLIDKITQDISQFLGLSEAENIVEYETISQKKLFVPQWYLHYQGHKLEEAIKNTYQPLKRFRREGDLKKDILKKVIDDIPELLPIDFMILFESLMKV